MRKLLFPIIFILLISAAAASSVTSDGSVPDDVLAVIEERVVSLTAGRADIIVDISSYSEDNGLFPGRIFSTFTAESGSASLVINAIGDDRESLLESISGEIRNILFYEESLMAPSPRLDYIYGGSYSFLADEYYRRGTRLRAVDSDGRVRGLFETAERYDGAVMLEPLYLADPVPGLPLEKCGAWTAFLSAAMSPDFSSPSFEITAAAGRSDLIYPFMPLLFATYYMDGGDAYFYGGLGIGASFDLWRMFPTVSFTLVEEGRITADASVLLGTGPAGFDWRGRFSISYEHSPLPSFFWRIGYVNLQGRSMLSVGGGGRF